MHLHSERCSAGAERRGKEKATGRPSSHLLVAISGSRISESTENRMPGLAGDAKVAHCGQPRHQRRGSTRRSRRRRQRSRTMHSLTMVSRNEAVSAAGLTRLAGQSCTRSAPLS